MVTVAVPVVAVLLAVNVSVLVEVVGSYRTPRHTARQTRCGQGYATGESAGWRHVIVVAPLLPW